MLDISFSSLLPTHFKLMLKWLEVPHVKKWWDCNISYTLDLVKEKYENYTQGYKIVDGIKKPINAYIINFDDQPIGYIQLYNAYDFPRSESLINLPKSLAAFDVFIGDTAYLRKGLGYTILTQFLKEFCKYDYVFVDPDKDNIAAIKTYEKVGFVELSMQPNIGKLWMLKKLVY